MPKYFVIDDSGLLGYYAVSLCVSHSSRVKVNYNLRLFVGQLQLMSAYCNMFKHQTVCQNRGTERPRMSWLFFLAVQLHL